jgi:hypothetical protein
VEEKNQVQTFVGDPEFGKGFVMAAIELEWLDCKKMEL